jgi:hypothetical protein
MQGLCLKQAEREEKHKEKRKKGHCDDANCFSKKKKKELLLK